VPGRKKLAYHYTNEEAGNTLRSYWTNACESCAIKHRCATSKDRRIRRSKQEDILERVQKRLDDDPGKIRFGRCRLYALARQPPYPHSLSTELTITRYERSAASRGWAQVDGALCQLAREAQAASSLRSWRCRRSV
jgi:hypothetical protein